MRQHGGHPLGVIGAGHGKLLLFGEHAAVYGYPAVGTSLPLETELLASEAPGPAVGSLPVRGALPTALHDTATAAAQRARGTLVMRSSLPHGVGLGSSAALCVALARAAGLSDAWAGSHELERAFHGSPSGADTGLAAHTGLAAFRWREPPVSGDRPLPTLTPLVASDLHLVFGAVARAGSTATNVRRIAEAYATGDARIHAALEELGSISAAAMEAFVAAGKQGVAGDRAQLGRRLGELATVAQRVLSPVLGLGDVAQAQLLEAGLEAGAAGGKLSGGGGGGAFVLFCDGEAVAERVFEALTGFGATSAAALLCQLALTIDECGTARPPQIMRQVGVATSSTAWRV